MPLINFSGVASGIDTEALIEAILDADRTVKIDPLDKKVVSADEESTKLKELKTLLEELKDIGSGFRSISGGAVSKSATSSDETVATATATNQAYNTSFALSVTTIASNSTASFNNTFASTSTVINSGAAASTVSVTVGVGGTPEVVTIDVDNTTTVSDFVQDFNETSTRAIATAVNVGTSASPSYKIVITTLDEGTLVGDIASISDPSTFFTSGSTINHATDATFSVTGISGTITRYSNSVSDVIPGVTMQLLKGGAVTTTISVNDDVDTTTTTVQEFVDKYNEIIAFIAENNTVAPPADNPNGLNVFGPLAKTRVDDNVKSALRNAISGANYSSGSQVKILADMGIVTQSDGTLRFDVSTSPYGSDSTFSKAMTSESGSVQAVLADLGDLIGGLETAGGLVDPFTKFNGLIGSTISANDEEIDDLNDRITTYETALAKKEEALRAQFARLESLMGNLQAKQSSLTSALASLPGIKI